MKIAHLADIQIRAHSRHEEYAKSFEHLFASLRSNTPDRIVLAGDILHHKTTLSPEAVDLCQALFSGLSDIAPLDVILGNHDLAMNNLERLDSLSPIVNAINSERIMLYKHSGLYWYHGPKSGGFTYVVMSCQDSPEKWEQCRQHAIKTSSEDGILIALWHGTVNGSVIGNGQALQSPHDLSMFKGMDYVMLGDIHEHQILDKERRIAYPGSYPQQSYGETTRKGYLLWEIQDKANHLLEFVSLPLVHPFYTVDAHEVLSMDLQRKARIRVLCNGLSKAEQHDLARKVRQEHEAIEVRIVDETPQIAKVADAIETDDLRSLATQERLLKDYAKDRLSAGQQKELLDLNARANDALSTDDVLRNARYKIESIKFSNLFSFGHDNVLDLTKHKGVIGVQGKNRSGKSSLVVDVPMLGFFNKISKPVARNGDYINAQRSDAEIELNLRLDDHVYRIHRCIEKRQVQKRNGTVETKSVTSLDFECDGKSLNALDRADTDKQIRKMFGTADDFLRTSVAAQFDLLGFIEDKAADRKATLGRYFDLDFFAEKLAYAAKQRQALESEVRNLERQDYAGLRKEIETKQTTNTDTIQRLSGEEKKTEELLAASVERLRDIQAPRISPFKDDMLKIKNQYTQQRYRIQRLEQDIADMLNYECIDYEKCCMRKREEVLRDELRTANNEKLQCYDKMHDLLSRQKSFLDAQDADAGESLRNAQKESDKHSSYLQAVRFDLRECIKREGSLNARVDELERSQQRLKAARDQQMVVSLFCEAMGKDGIPAQIVKTNIGVINGAIADLLQNNTAFTIWLEYTDKESSIMFQEHQGVAREIEICSGMEKTMAAIAIRAALISVTSLPVSNIFILDEAFTALDVEHFEAMGKILESLKRVFDTTLIICHDEYIKDLCDDMIVVARDEQDTSRIFN